MLESAVAFADCSHEEYVTLHRRRLAEEANVMLAQSLEVALQPARVGSMAAGDHDVVRHAPGAEARERELAHLHGVIDELVVVRCDIGAEAVGFRAFPRHRGGNAPIAVTRPSGPNDLELARCAFLPENAQEHAGSVEESVSGVEMRAAHRQVPRVHFDAHRQGPVDGLRAPGVLIEFLEGDRAVAAPRPEANAVTPP